MFFDRRDERRLRRAILPLLRSELSDDDVGVPSEALSEAIAEERTKRDHRALQGTEPALGAEERFRPGNRLASEMTRERDVMAARKPKRP